MPSESPLFTSDQERLRLLQALRESEILRELSALLASSLDLMHILQVLVKRTTEVCEVERCAVWLLEESSGHFVPKTLHNSAQHISQRDMRAGESVWYRSTLPLRDPVIRRLLDAHGMIVVEDLHHEPTMQIIAEKFLVRSILLIALLREGRVVGMMSLDNPGKSGMFSAEQQQLARSIGQQAAVAIDNARLYQQAQMERKRAERLIGRAQSIYHVAMAVNSDEDLSTVLGIATQHLVSGLDADGGAIALLDREALLLASTTNLYQDAPTVSPPLVDLPQCCTSMLDEAPHFVTQEQMEDVEKGWYQKLGLANVMIVPLTVGAQSQNALEKRSSLSPYGKHCVGFAFVNYQRSHHHPSKGQCAFAQDIAAQCALAIEKNHILTNAYQAASLATERANTLDAVFNAMTEGIMVLDQDGQVLVSNNTASHFLGMPLYAKEQLSTFLQRYPTYTQYGQPIAYEDFPLTRALRGERVRGERFVTRRADNSERAVELNVAPLFDGEARRIGTVSAFRDVTEQVRVERRIRKALDTMLHAAEEVSGVTDMTEILRRVLTMTLGALNCERGLVQLYDSERRVFTPFLSIGFSAEEEVHWNKEQKYWFASDVQQNKEPFASLIEGHATLFTPEGLPTQSDSNSSSPDIVLMAPLIHNNHLLGMMTLDSSAETKKDTAQPLSSGHVRPLRREFTIWDIAVVEGIAQFAGLAIEQTKWQSEAEVARTNEAAMRASNALKDEFLSITAHEFRTPLTIVLAHSQLMARVLRRTPEMQQKEKLQESITIIEEQSHQLTNIVNTFLEVTRLNKGQIILNKEKVDLLELLKQVVSHHSATTTIHTIHFTTDADEPCCTVMGDSARLLQIFANLLQNAIKYSPYGGPITVSLKHCKEDTGTTMIEVSVEDKGIGVPKDAQPHLFERFYRAPNVEGSQTRGVGLGLYVVAEFLRLHGGTIRVESSGEYGEGSRFVVTLPALESEVITIG